MIPVYFSILFFLIDVSQAKVRAYEGSLVPLVPLAFIIKRFSNEQSERERWKGGETRRGEERKERREEEMKRRVERWERGGNE